ncbi:MAG: cryptochrome/photolyase family protein [Gemmataceae bacterium]
MPSRPSRVRHLILVLGDQLDLHSSAFDGFDHRQDVVWMAEVVEESTHVWSHKARIALFLSGMRHFRDLLQHHKRPVHYRHLDDPDNRGSLPAELEAACLQFQPAGLIVTEPGDWRVRQALIKTAQRLNLPLEIRLDRHFLSSVDDFRAFAASRKQTRQEYFYRLLRRRHGILMNGDEPEGGQWNFDADNRGSFSREGPGLLPAVQGYKPDTITRDVLALVEHRFPTHPGSLEDFDWPVTPAQAQQALEDFIRHRLPNFGAYQDAMWTEQPYLYHARLAAALNLKLLDPRDALKAAEAAYRSGQAPLEAVEGFIRQILGWREYVRGIYWSLMPEYGQRNALQAKEALPAFYWTGDTEMHCMRQCLRQTLDLGYAHHIQRLMVTGLYALQLGVEPSQVHEWYLAVYVDAVEWVELPNTLGMALHADGGVMASKPYAASGKYIQRMSNYCQECRFDPAESVGERACPFTTLYWDFLLRHRTQLARIPRMKMQVLNLNRLSQSEQAAIQDQARRHRLQVVSQVNATS